MGFFGFNSAGHNDVDIALRIHEGKLYKLVQLIAISVFLFAVVLVILEMFKLVNLGFTENEIIISIGVVGAGGLAALPWVRVFERARSKAFKITAIVFLAIIGVCVILWIVCVFQIVGLIKAVMNGAEGDAFNGLIRSLNVIRASIIVSLQFVVASYIAMNIVKYRNTLIPYQVMAGASKLYIDFYFTLVLTAFTITQEGPILLPSATVLTNKWLFPLLIVFFVLAIFPNIVFRRTDRRRIIDTANDALEKSEKSEKSEKLEKTTEPAAESTPTEQAPDNADDNSVEEKLRKLKSLLDSGLITQEEYEKKRTEILDSI